MQVLFGVYQPKNDTVALAPSRPSAFDLLVIGVCAMMDAYASRCVCARRKHRTSRSVVGAESGETTNDCLGGLFRVFCFVWCFCVFLCVVFLLFFVFGGCVFVCC